MRECKRCGKRMNGELHHNSILWCYSCYTLWARGPVTQELSQEFVRDSVAPKDKRPRCVCGAH